MASVVALKGISNGPLPGQGTKWGQVAARPGLGEKR